jgi:serine protease
MLETLFICGFWKGNGGRVSLKRRIFAVLLVSGILLTAAVSLAITFSNPSVDVDSSSLLTQTMYRSYGASEGLWPEYVAGEVIIKFRKEVAEGEIFGLRVGQGAEEVYVSSFSFGRVWRVPPSKTVEEWVDFFGKHPLVEYAEPNYVRYALWYPDDPAYGYQWHFDDDHTNNPGGASSNPYGGVNGGGIRMEEAWTIANGSSNVVVAVIDTGVAYEDYPIPSYESNTVKGGVTDYQKAPDLVGTSFWQNVDEIAGNSVDDDGNGFVDDIHGWDFVNDDAHPNDNNGHGTHVTGTIAQTTNNGLGAAGIAFNTTIMPIKVLSYSGGGSDAGVAAGIYYAVDNGAKIINLSLGGDGSSITLENATAYAYNHGVVVVAASGNDGTESVDYPAANDDYVIAVGATRYDETRASYSDYGASLDLVAPGGDVDVDQNGDDKSDGVLQQTFKPYEGPGKKADPTDWTYYYFFDGTSMATPHVSGVAALLLAKDSSLTPNQIRNALESTAEDLGASGRDDFYGWGLIDAYAALQSVVPPVYLLLSVEPFEAAYFGGEALTFSVDVFNLLNPGFEGTLAWSVTGPGDYYVFDFERVIVAADAVDEFSFSWVVPDVAGTYVVEVCLVPPQLTAYDAVWLEAA